MPASDVAITRQQWKWSILAGMASCLDAGSIVALGVGMVNFERAFSLTKTESGCSRPRASASSPGCSPSSW